MSAQFEAGQGKIAHLRKVRGVILRLISSPGRILGANGSLFRAYVPIVGKEAGSLADTFPLRKRWGGYVVGFILQPSN